MIRYLKEEFVKSDLYQIMINYINPLLSELKVLSNQFNVNTNQVYCQKCGKSKLISMDIENQIQLYFCIFRNVTVQRC